MKKAIAVLLTITSPIWVFPWMLYWLLFFIFHGVCVGVYEMLHEWAEAKVRGEK